MNKTKESIIRVFLAILAAIFTVLYIGPVITTGQINIGILTGFMLAAAALIYSVFFRKINLILKKATAKKAGKAAIGAVSAVLAICIIASGAALGCVFSRSSASSTQANTVIVLGCKVNGESPGPFLRSRINAAYDYLSKNPEAVAVLSGGQGNGENISEAECMFRSLTEKGIDPSRLFIEDKSTHTQQNFNYSLKILQENGITDKNITVITNDFHEYRAGKFAKKCGLIPHSYPSKTPWNGYMPFASREVYGILYQVFL